MIKWEGLEGFDENGVIYSFDFDQHDDSGEMEFILLKDSKKLTSLFCRNLIDAKKRGNAIMKELKAFALADSRKDKLSKL